MVRGLEMNGEDFKSAMSSIGYGIAWAGFWIGLGLFNFQGKGCTTGSPTVETAREFVK